MKIINPDDLSTDPPKMSNDIFVFDTLLQSAKVNEVTANTEFINELTKLNKLLTNSHKLTSKKYSIWKLLERHLDSPTNEILQGIDEQNVRKLIGSFKFSQIGKVTPTYYFDYEQWAKQEEDKEDHPAYIRQNSNTDYERTSYSQISKNLSKWDQNIRHSIRALLAKKDFKVAYTLHIEILELIRQIIERLLSHRFAPKYTKHANYEMFGTKKSKTFDLHIKYCELCWRHTLRSTKILSYPEVLRTEYSELESKGISNFKNINTPISFGDLCQSNRYCHIHNPSDSQSKYRADLRYKNAFKNEILALQLNDFDKSNFPATFKYMEGYEQDLRKAAYDLVHSKLLLNQHQPDFLPKKSLAAQVLELKQKGLKQSEIALILKKSRQEVSRANKKIESLIKARENEHLIYHDTDEPFTLLEISKPNNDAAQISLASELRQQGISISQIARNLERFPYTVQEMLKLHESNKSPRNS